MISVKQLTLPGIVTTVFKPEALAIGIRLESLFWSRLLEKIPDQKIKDTRYNRQTLKWFSYRGIDVKTRQILFQCRLRVMHFEDKPWSFIKDSGTWTIYDNAWDVKAGLNLEVDNRRIRGNVIVCDVQSDWPSGLGGIFLSCFDAIIGVNSWLLSGSFSTLSDLIGQIGGDKFNRSGLGSIDKFLNQLNDLNNKHLIYLSHLDYQSEGVWLWLNVEQYAINQVLSGFTNVSIPID